MKIFMVKHQKIKRRKYECILPHDFKYKGHRECGRFKLVLGNRLHPGLNREFMPIDVRLKAKMV